MLVLARISIDNDTRPTGDEPKLDDTSTFLAFGTAVAVHIDVSDRLWLGPSVGAEWRPIELGFHYKFAAGTGDAYTAGLVVGLRL